jgi:hypothetical protein
MEQVSEAFVAFDTTATQGFAALNRGYFFVNFTSREGMLSAVDEMERHPW